MRYRLRELFLRAVLRYGATVVVPVIVAHPINVHPPMKLSMFNPPLSCFVAVVRLQCGVNPVVVHGGGPQIAAMLKRLDIPTSFVEVSSPRSQLVVLSLGG